MKYECKPQLEVAVTLSLSHRELIMLNTIASYGLSVVEPIIGRNPAESVSQEWGDFLRSLQKVTGEPLNRFADAVRVFTGERVAAYRNKEERPDGEKTAESK